jgi:hypothetical protein
MNQMTANSIFVEKRPYTFTLIFLFLCGLTALLLAGLLLIEPAVGSASLTLARLTWRLTPPLLWPGAIFIVAVWLLALRRLWTNGA